MRHQSKLAGVLAASAVLPLVLPRQDVEALEHALERTVRALEALASRAPHAAEEPRDRAQIELLRASTEAPLASAEALDERLQELRGSVGALRMELDALEAPGLVGRPAGAAEIAARHAPTPTTGLDETTRALLRRLPGTAIGRVPNDENDDGNAGAGAKAPIAPIGAQEGGAPAADASADPIGEARAAFRAGRFDHGLACLRGRTSPAARYWRARCLAQLGRLEEAIALLEDLAADEALETLAAEAASELEFLRWQREFLAALPTGLRSGGKEAQQE